MTEFEKMALALEQTGDYKVLRRLRAGGCVQPHDGSPTRRAIILDIETTGFHPHGSVGVIPDEVIELAMLAFAFTDDFKIVDVVGRFQSFREPTKPIPITVERITGITDAMVKGHVIDLDEVSNFVAGTDLIIAHNAKFDRRFAEILHRAAFRDKDWACSWSQLDWSESGGGRLINIVNAAGMFHEAHRALDDCHALLEVLARPLGPSGIPALGQLVEAAGKPTVRVWALGSPFDKKELLKSRNYRWNSGEDGGPKAWYVDVAEDAEAAEIAFLRSTIFGPNWEPRRSLITARDRFSDRG